MSRHTATLAAPTISRSSSQISATRHLEATTASARTGRDSVRYPCAVYTLSLKSFKMPRKAITAEAMTTAMSARGTNTKSHSFCRRIVVPSSTAMRKIAA